MKPVLWNVPAYTQTTAKLCWEACARMMWAWRFKNLSQYKNKAGAYANLDKGLTEIQMDVFYKLLGLRSLPEPTGKNLRYALSWSPVIFDGIDEGGAHAMVLVGFDGAKYTVINPCTAEVVDFEKDTSVCVGSGTKARTPTEVEQPLGRYMWYW